MKLTDLLSGDVIESLAKSTGASKKDTTSVLANALPDLMKSLSKNASTKEGAASLSKALDNHTTDDGIGSLLQNIDLEDGIKILGHILGDDQASTSKKISKKSGVDSDLTSTILASAAPLLLSALGSEKKKSGTREDGLSDLLGSLFDQNDDGFGLDDVFHIAKKFLG